jgi:oligopeptidase A
MSDFNPLLQNWDLPPWSSVRAEHLVPALTTLVATNRQTISNIVASQSAMPNWDDLVLAVDETDARLEQTTAVIEVLSMAYSDEVDWLLAASTSSKIVDEYKAWKMGNKALFRAYQSLDKSPIARNFDASRQAALSKILRKFRLSGIELTVERQQELAGLDGEISRLEALFLGNLDGDSSKWHKRIDDIGQLAGLPVVARQRFAQLAKAAGRSGWLLPLDLNTHLQVMTYAQNRALREEYFLAYFTRASEQSPHSGQNDNGPVLESLLALRHQKARLLGFDNFAQLRQASVAGESTAAVSAFMQHMTESSEQLRRQDTEALNAFALTRGIAEVQGWDQEFLVEQLRNEQFDGALEGLRDYFPLEGTLRRLCLFSERMFGVRIAELTTFERWHDHLRLFEISEHGQILGYLYLDPFKGENTLDFAGTMTLRNRRITAEGRPVLPIALISCNLASAVEGHPTLLEHLDLRVLFHEFGHCLQHILTRSPHHTLSGISQMARATAEFSGELFERWCYSREFLLWLGAHHRSGERLSEKRVDAVLAALRSQASRQTAIHLTMAMLDFDLHASHGDGRSVAQVFKDVQAKIPQLKLPESCRFANGFDYMVTGYQAMVYAYLWSRLLASEVFKRFEQDWVFNPTTGREFRETFFTPGDAHSLLGAAQTFLGRPIELSSPAPNLDTA